MDPREILDLFSAIEIEGHTVEEVLVSVRAYKVGDVLKRLEARKKDIESKFCVYMIFRTHELAYGGLVNLDDFLGAIKNSHGEYFSVAVYDYDDAELKEVYVSRNPKSNDYSILFITKDHSSFKALTGRRLVAKLKNIKRVGG